MRSQTLVFNFLCKKKYKNITKNHTICLKHEEKTVKEVKIIFFLVFVYKSYDFLQIQKSLAMSHDRVTITFRNSFQPYSNLFQPIPFCSSPSPAYSSLFQLIPVYPSLSKPIPNFYSLSSSFILFYPLSSSFIFFHHLLSSSIILPKSVSQPSAKYCTPYRRWQQQILEMNHPD